MREILFGAKALHDGSWVEGDPIHSKRMAGGFNEHRIRNQETGMETDIDPETLGQFTGLYDCTKWEELTEAEQKAFLNEKLEEDRQPTKEDWKGRKIFEGDVLNIPHFGDINKALMCFTEYNLAFSLRNEKGYDRDIFYYAKHNRFPTINLKIIGNIADNPDLITKGDTSKTKI